MKAVLAFNPDAVVLGADPPQLDCCDLLSEIKGSESTHDVRVVMLSRGGSAERTRGLDLGADDVLSLTFDSHGLLSRVRSQLRTKSAGGRASRAPAPCRGKSKRYSAGGDSGQPGTAHASGWRPGDCCRAHRCGPGLFILVPPYSGTKHARLCCNHSIAELRLYRTTIDGTLSSCSGPHGTRSIPGERSTKSSTPEEERRPEIANCSQQTRKRFGFAKSINRGRN